MRVLGILFFILGILSGILGVRSFLRDVAYEEASITVRGTVRSAQVTPNSSGKTNASIRLMIYYMRDGVLDSLEEKYPQFYSKEEPLPTVEQLKARKPYVRYVPKDKRSNGIPDWVMVSNKDIHDGVYGSTGFRWMLIFFMLGVLLIFASKAYKNFKKDSNLLH